MRTHLSLGGATGQRPRGDRCPANSRASSGKEVAGSRLWMLEQVVQPSPSSCLLQGCLQHTQATDKLVWQLLISHQGSSTTPSAYSTYFPANIPLINIVLESSQLPRPTTGWCSPCLPPTPSIIQNRGGKRHCQHWLIAPAESDTQKSCSGGSAVVHVPLPPTGMSNGTYRPQRRTDITHETFIRKTMREERKGKQNKNKTHYTASYAESHWVFPTWLFP